MPVPSLFGSSKAIASCALALATLVGCNCGSSLQKVKPSLEVTPLQLSFPITKPGTSSAPQTITLQAGNVAEVTTQISISTTFGGTGIFAIQGTPPTSVYETPVTLSVVFTPTADKTYTGEVLIQSNDASQPLVSVLLSGQGGTPPVPQISVTPQELSLSAIACSVGATATTCQDSQSVTIASTGMTELTVNSVGLAAASGETSIPSGLAVTMGPNPTLAAGQSEMVTVSWQPPGPISATQTSAATLVVTSDDPAHPQIDVPITTTASPAGPPTACVNVLSVTQNEYMNNPQGGPPNVVQSPLPSSQWQDATTENLIHVRPGSTITLTSQLATVDAMGYPQVTQQDLMNPCTKDPNGFTLTLAWSLTSAPTGSTAVVNPDMGTQTSFEVDAEGQYSVSLVATNSLGVMSQPAVLNIDAEPDDAIFAQLSWPMGGPGIDLDIHLLVDQGPGIGTAPENMHVASMFCLQDCFFYNFAPDWFTNATGDEIPHLLRDDQGFSGGFESVDLVTAPPSSSFRVAAHYFAQNGSASSTTPTLTIRSGMTSYGPFSPPTPMDMVNQAWFAVQVSFDANSAVMVTPLTTNGMPNAPLIQTTPTPIPPGDTVPPDFTQQGATVGMCP